MVAVGGKVAKAALPIKAGDEITITRRDRIITVRVMALPVGRQTSRKEATTLIELMRDEVVEDERDQTFQDSKR